MNLFFAIVWAMLPACQTEDSPNCKWDSSLQGNHAGNSFLDIGGFVFVQVKK